MQEFDKQNFLTYLKEYYPHLYHFEMEIQKIADKSGFGDFSMTCIVRNGEIFSIDFGGVWVKQLYESKKKVDNLPK